MSSKGLLLYSEEQFFEAIETRSQEIFQIHREQFEKGLIFERFQTDILALAQTISEKDTKEYKRIDETVSLANQGLETKLRTLEKELLITHSEFNRIEREKKAVEKERDILLDANKRLRKELEGQESGNHILAISDVT